MERPECDLAQKRVSAEVKKVSLWTKMKLISRCNAYPLHAIIASRTCL